MSQQNPLLCTINILPIKYFHFSFLWALTYKGMTFAFFFGLFWFVFGTEFQPGKFMREGGHRYVNCFYCIVIILTISRLCRTLSQI